MKNLLFAVCMAALAIGMIMPPAEADAGNRIVARITDTDHCDSDNVQAFRLERAAVKSYDTVERVTIVPQVSQYRVERIVSPVVEKQYILRSTDGHDCHDEDRAEILYQRELGDVGSTDYGDHCDVSQFRSRATTAYFTSHNDRDNIRERLEDRRDDRQRQRDRQRSRQKDVVVLELNDNHHHHNNRQQNRQQQRHRSSENITLKFRSR